MKKLLMSFLVMLSLFGCNESSKRELHIYTWADYINPELVSQFEMENRCKVVVDTYDSNESMYAKLKSGAAGYDIIMPTSYFVDALVKDGIIRKLDTNRLDVVLKHFDNRYNGKIY